MISDGLNFSRMMARRSESIRYQVHKDVDARISTISFPFIHYFVCVYLLHQDSTSDEEEFLLSARNSVIASATFTTSVVKRSHKCSSTNRRREKGCQDSVAPTLVDLE